jgi:peptide deformylase
MTIDNTKFLKHLRYDKIENIDTADLQDLFDLNKAMIDAMVEMKTNSINTLPHNIMAVGNHNDRDSIITMFNPKIVDIFGPEIVLEETDVFFPGLFLKIKRPANVRVRFTNKNGEVNTIKYTGMTARLILHENDYFLKEDFRKRATKYHLSVAYKNMKLLNRNKRKVIDDRR